MTRLYAFVPVFLLLSACAEAQSPSGDLSWISGHWRSDENERVSEEFWTDDTGGLMLGGNRTIAGGQARAFECLRIQSSPEGRSYCAQPGGGEATCFALSEQGDNWVLFENPDHDFPQRIRYERDGGRLTATISDLSGEQSFAFQWNRVGD